MIVTKTKAFHRLARRDGLTDERLCAAVAEMQAGLVDANLGSGLFKKRVAMPGQGKSGSWRTLLGFVMRERAVFLYVFPKSRRETISKPEERALKALARFYLSLDDAALTAAVTAGELVEVPCEL